MKKILIGVIILGCALPGVLLAQGDDFGTFEVFGKEPIEPKPKAFYYEIDPYQPIEVMLMGGNRFILDENLTVQVEKAVGRSTFMADPNLLRKPTTVDTFYDLAREDLNIDVSSYQERGVSGWEVQILDAGGITFRTLEGSGSLPAMVSWDCRNEDRTRVMAVGDIYSFIVELEMRDGSQIRRIGRPIDLNGLAYENVVAIKESEIESYDMVTPARVANYYQYVINRFLENRSEYSKIHIKASSNSLAQSARRYLQEHLHNISITTQEVFEYSRVEFIFQ